MDGCLVCLCVDGVIAVDVIVAGVVVGVGVVVVAAAAVLEDATIIIAIADRFFSSDYYEHLLRTPSPGDDLAKRQAHRRHGAGLARQGELERAGA